MTHANGAIAKTAAIFLPAISRLQPSLTAGSLCQVSQRKKDLSGHNPVFRPLHHQLKQNKRSVIAMKVLGYPEGSATDSFLTMIPYPNFRAEGDGEKKQLC